MLIFEFSSNRMAHFEISGLWYHIRTHCLLIAFLLTVSLNMKIDKARTQFHKIEASTDLAWSNEMHFNLFTA